MLPRTRHRTTVCFVIGIVLGYQLAISNRIIYQAGEGPVSNRVDLRRDDVFTETGDVYAALRDVAGRRVESGTEWRDENDKNTSHLIKFNDMKQHRDDDRIARTLYKSVRILCWVMTSPANLQKRALHIRETWGRRCNLLLFFSEADDPHLPAIGLKVRPGRSHLTAKSMRAFDYIYRHHLDDADWFLKTDDDTYVIVENLRYLLSAHSPEEPVYFGQHFRHFARQGYFSGGAGYVLSREAVRRFGSRDVGACAVDKGAEDVQFGRCMETIGVRTGNSRDRLDRSRFHSLSLRDHIRGRYPDWYRRFDNYSDRQGIQSLSDYPISFHYVQADDMYVLEYFTYHASVYGIIRGLQQLNPDTNTTDMDRRDPASVQDT